MEKFVKAEKTSDSAFPIARAGFPFIFVGGFVTAVAALSGWGWLTGLALLFTLFCLWFFRDPDRMIPADPNVLVSPADGKVIVAKMVDNPPYGEGPAFQISVFMNVFNVHVNRIPFDGIVREVRYSPGRFFNANLDKASEGNERNAVCIETAKHGHFWTVQIAGLIARRIICRVQEGDEVTKGSRFGLICFGSRLDLFLPPDFKCLVKEGEKTTAGTTKLGVFE